MWTFLLACVAEKPAGGHVDSSDAAPELSSVADDLCSRSVAGEAGQRTPIVALSEAHADIRLFGVAADFPEADAALIAAVSADDAVASPDLDAYAALGVDVCHLAAAGAAPLPAAEVEERDGWIFVRPGTGALEVPDAGLPVALDLRGLPQVDGLDAVLRTALAATLPHDLTLPSRKVRTWFGYVDQWFVQRGAYTVDTEVLAGEQIPASGSSNPVLVVLTDPYLPPAAAEIAGAIALDGTSGFVVGRSVVAAVAESYWSPVGEAGLVWRGEQLETPTGDPWPDVIPPLVETDDPEAALAGLDLTAWTVPEAGGRDRKTVRNRDPWSEIPDATESVATHRAALVIAHGALRRFFPYFDVVGDGIDGRLEEILAEPIEDPADRYAQRRRLGRMAEVIHDGHAFFGSWEGYIDEFLPVTLDHVDGRPVIVHSADPGLLPGDTVLAIGDVPVEDVYADWMSWHSGATDGYARDLAGREMWFMWGPETFTVEDPDGVRRDVLVEPSDYDTWLGVPFTAHLRPSGLLDDLGHPEVAYLNLAYDVTTRFEQVEELLTLAKGAQGLVVDMRGYPEVDIYEVARRLATGKFLSPIFEVPVLRGPGRVEVERFQYTEEASDQAWTGPVVLLLSPVSVSAAETLAQLLVDAGRVTVVGRRSAGTNGSMTGVTLPGMSYLSFTGMRTLNADGSQLHGVGIVPDVDVPADAVRYRDGADPELEAAIEVLVGG